MYCVAVHSVKTLSWVTRGNADRGFGLKTTSSGLTLQINSQIKMDTSLDKKLGSEAGILVAKDWIVYSSVTEVLLSP